MSDAASLHPVVLKGGNTVIAKFMLVFFLKFLFRTFHPAAASPWDL